jgi:8-oxo-dGTP diphosphatase
MSGAPLPVVDVAVGVVRAADGSVLLAERTARQISAGFWELPGGKIDPGETPAQAAARELAEEVGIESRKLRPRITYDHTFRTKRVRLHFFDVLEWAGTPNGREGQRLAWVDPGRPRVAPILPSNARVLASIGLPRLCFASRESDEPAAFLRALPQALSAGVRFVLVRASRLAPDQRMAFARRVDTLAAPFGAQVLLAGKPLEAQRAGVAGLLSCGCEVSRVSARPAVSLWAATCSTQADLARALALGADLIVASPVYGGAQAEGHAEPEPGGTAPIGWEGLRRLAEICPIPVYADGGTSAADLSRAGRAGAAGVIAPDY